MSRSIDSEAWLSWILAAVAAMLGAVAFTDSAGFFVTFMTGNTDVLKETEKKDTG